MSQESGTHLDKYTGKIATRTSGFPVEQRTGKEFYNTTDNVRYRRFSDGIYYGHIYDTTTSTSTTSSTSTTTSTSTSTTSTSTSTTSTSTSSSTTTTL